MGTRPLEHRSLIDEFLPNPSAAVDYAKRSPTWNTLLRLPGLATGRPHSRGAGSLPYALRYLSFLPGLSKATTFSVSCLQYLCKVGFRSRRNDWTDPVT